MKKILCLIDSLGPGGAQRQMVGLASFLKEKGYDVILAYYHDDRFYLDKLQSSEVPCVYLEEAKTPIPRMWRVSRYINQLAPDVVISYLETPSICACVSRFFNHKFKLIVSERSTTQHTGRNEKIRFNLFRIADYVVPNSYSQATYLKTAFPKLTNKIVTIPNFVDLEHFVPPKERNRQAIPEVMIAASIWTLKNTLRFIDAVEKLKNKGYQFHVSWYGKSEVNIDYFNKCQTKITRYGIEKFISMIGNII